MAGSGDEYTITAKFVADVSEFEQGAEDAAQSAKDIESSTSELSDGFGSIEQSAKQAGDGLSELGAAGKASATGMGDTVTYAKDAAEWLEKMTTSSKDSVGNLGGIGTAGKEASDGLSGIGVAGKEVSANFAEIGSAGKTVTDDLGGIGSAGKNAASGIYDIDAASKTAATEIADIGSASKETENNLADIGSAGKDASDGIQTVGENSRQAADGIMTVGTASEEAGSKVKTIGEDAGPSFQDIIEGASRAIQPWMQLYQAAQLAGQAIGAAGAQAADIKSTASAFDSLTQDASKADAILKELNSSAAADDFGKKAVDDAAQHMLMMGADTKTIGPEIQKVADGIAAMGGNAQMLSPVIDQLGKIQTEARVTTSDMNNLVSQGLPAWQALAQGMGTTVTQAQKQVTDGDLQGAKAYQDILNGLEQYGGAAEAQSQNLGPEYDRLKASGEGAFSGITDWISKDLEGINEMIDGTWKLSNIFDQLGSPFGMGMNVQSAGQDSLASPAGPPTPSNTVVTTWGGSIPGHAAGGTNLSGLSIIGENGPELFDPNGGSIYPLDGGSSAFSALPALGNSGGPVTINFHVDSQLIAQQILPHIAPMIRVMTGRRG